MDNGDIWTFGPPYTLTLVDGTTGDRLGYDPSYGPLFKANGAKPGIWIHPSERWLVLEVGGGIILFDPLTNNANMLSY